MNRLTLFARTLRIHQWVKNLLIFIPFLLGWQQVGWTPVGEVLLAFVAFGLCASASYVINDLLDREADRRHPSKRHRPIAAGAVAPGTALLLAALALAGGLGLAAAGGHKLLMVVSVYLLVTVTYSLWLKSIAMLDVVTLGLLYTLRIIAGIIAAGVELSYWILVFSMFFFVSLAMLKRYSELYNLRQRDEETAQGRGYCAQDLELMAALGGASGYIAVLIMVLYIHDPVIAEKYAHPQWLWLVFPALLYWISRMWLIAHRGRMDEDPVLYAIHDRPSYIVAVVCVLGFVLSL